MGNADEFPSHARASGESLCQHAEFEEEGLADISGPRCAVAAGRASSQHGKQPAPWSHGRKKRTRLPQWLAQKVATVRENAHRNEAPQVPPDVTLARIPVGGRRRPYMAKFMASNGTFRAARGSPPRSRYIPAQQPQRTDLYRRSG